MRVYCFNCQKWVIPCKEDDSWGEYEYCPKCETIMHHSTR